jgi:hypothetical protein
MVTILLIFIHCPDVITIQFTLMDSMNKEETYIFLWHFTQEFNAFVILCLRDLKSLFLSSRIIYILTKSVMIAKSM